ncbi:hypothetical protein ACHAXT_008704 [Thalassiosira profunda]
MPHSVNDPRAEGEEERVAGGKTVGVEAKEAGTEKEQGRYKSAEIDAFVVDRLKNEGKSTAPPGAGKKRAADAGATAAEDGKLPLPSKKRPKTSHVLPPPNPRAQRHAGYTPHAAPMWQRRTELDVAREASWQRQLAVAREGSYAAGYNAGLAARPPPPVAPSVSRAAGGDNELHTSFARVLESVKKNPGFVARDDMKYLREFVNHVSKHRDQFPGVIGEGTVQETVDFEEEVLITTKDGLFKAPAKVVKKTKKWTSIETGKGDGGDAEEGAEDEVAERARIIANQIRYPHLSKSVNPGEKITLDNPNVKLTMYNLLKEVVQLHKDEGRDITVKPSNHTAGTITLFPVQKSAGRVQYLASDHRIGWVKKLVRVSADPAAMTEAEAADCLITRLNYLYWKDIEKEKKSGTWGKDKSGKPVVGTIDGALTPAGVTPVEVKVASAAPLNTTTVGVGAVAMKSPVAQNENVDGGEKTGDGKPKKSLAAQMKSETRNAAAKILAPRLQRSLDDSTEANVEDLPWNTGEKSVSKGRKHDDAMDLQAMLIAISRANPIRAGEAIAKLLHKKQNVELLVIVYQAIKPKKDRKGAKDLNATIVAGIKESLAHHSKYGTSKGEATGGSRSAEAETFFKYVCVASVFHAVGEHDNASTLRISQALGTSTNQIKTARARVRELLENNAIMTPPERAKRKDRIRDAIEPYVFEFLFDDEFTQLVPGQKQMEVTDPRTGEKVFVQRRVFIEANKKRQHLLFLGSRYYLEGFQPANNNATVGYDVWMHCLKKVGAFVHRPPCPSGRKKGSGGTVD